MSKFIGDRVSRSLYHVYCRDDNGFYSYNKIGLIKYCSRTVDLLFLDVLNNNEAFRTNPARFFIIMLAIA